jgi:hypothetical protein
MRNKLLEAGVIVAKGEHLEFPDDYIFSSASAAASIVLGRNANGLADWKLKDGRTLKAFESNEKSGVE